MLFRAWWQSKTTIIDAVIVIGWFRLICGLQLVTSAVRNTMMYVHTRRRFCKLVKVHISDIILIKLDTDLYRVWLTERCWSFECWFNVHAAKMLKLLCLLVTCSLSEYTYCLLQHHLIRHDKLVYVHSKSDGSQLIYRTEPKARNKEKKLKTKTDRLTGKRCGQESAEWRKGLRWEWVVKQIGARCKVMCEVVGEKHGVDSRD